MANRTIKVALCGDWDIALIARLERLLPDCAILNAAHKDHAAARDCEIVIPLGMAVTEELLAGSRIRLVHQFGVGYDKVDLDAARRHGVQVANAPSQLSGMAASVAEHAVMLLLACARLPSETEEKLATRRWVWTEHLNLGLAGKCAGLIGLGNIGLAVAQRLRAFDMKLIGVKRTAPETTLEGFDWVGGLDRLDDLCAQADFVVVAAPHNADSGDLINAEFLRRMKPDASLINVGRGAIVDEAALIEALDAKRIRAAGLDTVREEPPAVGSRLVGHPRIVLTPHIAGVTEVAFDGTTAIIGENIRRLRAGEDLRFRVA
ncbi:NAD(P)-dependent oxidoreductase [Leptospira interrogans]